MDKYSSEELTAALRAVNSIINKCEKAKENSQKATLIIRFLEIV